MSTAPLPHQVPISLREKLQEIDTEIRFRHRVYPGAISKGRMTKEQAARRIRIMEAIRNDYLERQAAEERDQAELFGTRGRPRL